MKLETPADVDREETIARTLARAWRCEWGRMGPYSPFDVYLMREARIAALAEIKTRGDRTCHGFSTVLINLNKWFSLMQGEIGLQLPCFYVVAFTDGIWTVRIGSLPVNTFKINYRGRSDRPQAVNDQAPVIEVPSAEFKFVCACDGIWTDGK